MWIIPYEKFSRLRVETRGLKKNKDISFGEISCYMMLLYGMVQGYIITLIGNYKMTSWTRESTVSESTLPFTFTNLPKWRSEKHIPKRIGGQTNKAEIDQLACSQMYLRVLEIQTCYFLGTNHFFFQTSHFTEHILI